MTSLWDLTQNWNHLAKKRLEKTEDLIQLPCHRWVFKLVISYLYICKVANRKDMEVYSMCKYDNSMGFKSKHISLSTPPKKQSEWEIINRQLPARIDLYVARKSGHIPPCTPKKDQQRFFEWWWRLQPTPQSQKRHPSTSFVQLLLTEETNKHSSVNRGKQEGEGYIETIGSGRDDCLLMHWKWNKNPARILNWFQFWPLPPT